MSDNFVRDFDQQQKDKRQRREHDWLIFSAKAQRKWEALRDRLIAVAKEMNSTATTLEAMRGEIRINTRTDMAHDNELYLDKVVHPAIYLKITLITHAEIIKIDQERLECDEGQAKNTSEILRLKLEENGDVNIYDTDGNLLTLDHAARYVLERFLS